MRDDHVFLGFNAPLPLAAEFRRLAAESDRTLSAELRQAMREYLAQKDEEPACQPAPATASMAHSGGHLATG